MEIEPKSYALFICGHNAGRSQMAEAFFNDGVQKIPLLAGKWEAISAGTRPKEEINPQVVQAMANVGINLEPQRHHPKGLDDQFIRDLGPNIRRVIIACDDECVLPPEIPANVPKEIWKLPDPSGQPFLEVVRVRLLVKARVDRLLKDLSRPE